MQSPAYSLVQSHLEDMRRAAATSALRAEARRNAVEGLSTRPVTRGLVVRPSIVRRMVGRLAI